MVDVFQETVLSSITITIIFWVLLLVAVSGVFIFQRRRSQLGREKERQRESYEREILRAEIELQSQTIRQTKDELQNDLDERLTQTLAHVNSLSHQLAGTPSEGALAPAVATLNRAIEAVRRLSSALGDNPIQQQGLVKSLSLELERVRRAGPFRTQFQCLGVPYSFGEQKEIVLFRIAQELIQNAVKHSDGGHLAVNIDYGADFLILIITDNGSGFDVEKEIDPSHSGLRTLRQRVRLLEGECMLNSQPGWGTRVEIRLPRTSL